MARTMVTTTDNPYDPFSQFDQWRAFDEIVAGYYTNSYMARVASLSPDLTGFETDREIEHVCDEICQMDLRMISPVTGKEVGYIKVTEKE